MFDISLCEKKYFMTNAESSFNFDILLRKFITSKQNVSWCQNTRALLLISSWAINILRNQANLTSTPPFHNVGLWQLSGYMDLAMDRDMNAGFHHQILDKVQGGAVVLQSGILDKDA